MSSVILQLGGLGSLIIGIETAAGVRNATFPSGRNTENGKFDFWYQ
jgi:hypothetical protein